MLSYVIDIFNLQRDQNHKAKNLERKIKPKRTFLSLSFINSSSNFLKWTKSREHKKVERTYSRQLVHVTFFMYLRQRFNHNNNSNKPYLKSLEENTLNTHPKSEQIHEPPPLNNTTYLGAEKQNRLIYLNEGGETLNHPSLYEQPKAISQFQLLFLKCVHIPSFINSPRVKLHCQHF